MATNKITKVTCCLFIIIWLLVVGMASCSRQEPTQEKIRTDFSILFPDYEIITVTENEREVVAVSYDIVCRKKGSNVEQKTFIQYIEDDDEWKISPKPTLPQ